MLAKSLRLIFVGWLCLQAVGAEIVQLCPPGYRYIDGMCYSSSTCPSGHYLHTNGSCLLQSSLKCPDEYFLNTDGRCYRTNPLPCPYEVTTTSTTTTTTEPTTTTTTTEPTTTTTTTEPTTTTTTTEPTTTTTETVATEPPPADIVQCPPGSILFEAECRKIVCAEGEYYEGRCIAPACPPGTVWRGRRCQEPGYITTVLEIGNAIHNRHEYKVSTENINHVEYNTPPPYNADLDKSYEITPAEIVATTTTRRPWLYSTPGYTTQKSVSKEPFPGQIPPPGCCIVKTPRICINYSPNWVCSSRQDKLCDPVVCKTPYVYLKPPHMVQSDNRKRVVVPPNPPLVACSTEECNESDLLDCSGCMDSLRDKCSLGCYNYYCPNGSCGFMNTEEYCRLYPGGFGCVENDGCIWDWCDKKC